MTNAIPRHGSTSPTEFLRVLTAPWLIIFGLTVWETHRGMDLDILEGIVLWLLGFAAFARFGINLHRLLLLGPDSVPGLGLQWSRRETQFLGWTMVISLFTAGIGYGAMLLVVPALAAVLGTTSIEPSEAVAYVVVLVSMLPALYVSGRWLLVLPATAIDRSCDLARAWRMSEGHGLKLLGMVVLFPLGIAYVLQLLIDTSLADVGTTPKLLIVAAISSLASAATAGVGVALLVSAYRQISGGTTRRVRARRRRHTSPDSGEQS